MIIHANVGSNLKNKKRMKEKSKFLLAATILILLFTLACRSKVPTQSLDVKKTDTIVTYESNSIADGYIFIDNFLDYPKIEDLISYKDFQNCVLYIDFWGIACGPCIKEFQFLKELKEKHKNKPLKFIYVADGPQRIQYQPLWKDLITKYELYGYHMPVSSVFLKSMMSIKGYKAVGTLPHYILVNMNGEIVYPNAERPSSKEKLYAQIDSLL